MRIAVPCAEDGSIFPHFGKAEKFEMYDTLGGEIKRRQQVYANGHGHAARAYLLASMGTDAVICTGIGDAAIQTLSDGAIEVYPGVAGMAEDAVNMLLSGKLKPADRPECHEHEQEAGCAGGCFGCHGCH